MHSRAAALEGAAQRHATRNQLVDFLQGCWDHKHMFAVVGVVAAFAISAVFAQPAQAATTSSTLVNYFGDKMLWMLGKVRISLQAPRLPVLTPQWSERMPWFGNEWLFMSHLMSPLHVPQISQLGVAAKVVLVLSSTVPFIFLLGNLYSYITKTEKQASYIRMYALLNRLPGAQVKSNPGPKGSASRRSLLPGLGVKVLLL